MTARTLPVLLVLLLVDVASAAAQPRDVSTLEGRILDESGEPMPGVLVTVTSPGMTPGRSSMATGADGRYSFPAIAPGRDYSLTARIPGYATIIAGPLLLEPGKTTRLDLTLKPASELEETIRVEARGEIVELSTTATGATYSAEFIEALPLVGRRFSDVLTLAPGVTDADGDGNLNVRGARDTGLQLRLDGTNATDPLTGRFGQQVNLEAIDELEIITAGAPAEFGRADGGFANAITKSGSNETMGSFKVFARSDFLDGDGANQKQGDVPDFDENNIYLTLGGPLKKNHVWYFTALERLDEEDPIAFTDGSFGLRTVEGWHAFAKVTWQAGPDHKLALQVNHDPTETSGNNIGVGVDPATDYRVRLGGPLPQLTWTAILSPRLLMQTVLSHLAGSLAFEPVSDAFRPIVIQRDALASQFTVRFPCRTANCQQDDSIRRTFLFQESARSVVRQFETGPYNIETAMDLERTTLKSDLTVSIEEALGLHAIKSGFEFNVEKYAERGLQNPVLTDETCEFAQCNLQIPTPPPGVRLGRLLLEVYNPLRFERAAEGLNAGAYIQDSWKPRPNLSVSAGLRFDHESVDSRGLLAFEPMREAREVLRRFDLLCDAAGSTCLTQREPGRPIGPIPGVVTPPPGHPALQFDLNQDGEIEVSGAEGALVFAPYTEPADLIQEPFVVTNTNFSPRFSVSWDPWSNGRTKFFTTWGTYYDRLFLGTVATGQLPSSYVAEWRLGPTVAEQALPGSSSRPLTDVVSINQTQAGLSTPYTVEWTAGVERELAPEWSLGATWIRRRGIDLLQDIDVNHITCRQFDSVYGVDPMDVCGDGGFLELDRFGGLTIESPFNPARDIPNGAIDLYVLNRRFNQVLRVQNANGSDYAAAELTLRKRLHRGWQMLMGYTWSRARGEAESFVNQEGNDPAVSDKVSGYLDYDQRHVFKMQLAAHLPRDIVIGSAVEWGSGLPYSFIATVTDLDDAHTLSAQRVFSLTGKKNDLRNESQLTIDARIEKRLRVGAAHVSAFLEGENLLDNDELRLIRIDAGKRGLVEGTRRFGRRWEIGLAIIF